MRDPSPHRLLFLTTGTPAGPEPTGLRAAWGDALRVESRVWPDPAAGPIPVDGRIDAVVLAAGPRDDLDPEVVGRLRQAVGDAAVVVLGSAIARDDARRFRDRGADLLLDRSSTGEAQLESSVLLAIDLARERSRRREIERVLESMPDAILVVADSGRVGYVNEAALALFDRSRDEIHEALLGFSIQDDVPSEICVLRRGDERICEIRVARIAWGGEGAVLASIRDVTERRRLEAQVLQSDRLASIGVLAAGVAHDFNNLLTIILGFQELLKGSLAADAEALSGLAEIEAAAGRAVDLTRQLLAFSRKQVLDPAVVDLNGVVQGIDRMLRRLIGADVSLRTVLQPDLGRVFADVGQIEQVIMNLVVNARDAMPEGGRLTMQTGNVELDENYAASHPEVVAGRHVMIAVSDDGVGMDRATLARIFEPFFTTKDKSRGTGLGLSTVYGIVKQSGGHVGVYSEPGRGTTFRVYFPRVDAVLPETASRAPDRLSLRGSETILVAEDEEQLRRFVVTVLENHGYRVMAAANGVEALRCFEQQGGVIDFVIADVVMPKLGGKDLVDTIRKRRPGLPILYISGYAENAMFHQRQVAEGLQILSKPFTGQALLSRIRKILGAAAEVTRVDLGDSDPPAQGFAEGT